MFPIGILTILTGPSSSGNTDLTNFISPSVAIAFKYIGTNSDGATWEVDNIVVTE